MQSKFEKFDLGKARLNHILMLNVGSIYDYLWVVSSKSDKKFTSIVYVLLD